MGSTGGLVGAGFQANQDELEDEETFKAGCMLLRSIAMGKLEAVREVCDASAALVNFRDYDRRTPLHIAASEGNEAIVLYLTSRGARKNRIDRWGGAPLDDALRHRHVGVVQILRKLGARSGAVDYKAQMISHAAAGCIVGVRELLDEGAAEVNCADYDKRTPLHLAASEGHTEVVAHLLEAGADPNAKDRWGNGPVDGADDACAKLLVRAGAEPRAKTPETSVHDDGNDEADLGHLDHSEVHLLDKLGGGSFGVVYRASWRGTPVAAKCLRVATESDHALALKDFHIEAKILKGLRHPNICMLLAYSNTPGQEMIINELMRCSLLDELRSATRGGDHRHTIARPRALRWMLELARGMAYLHAHKPAVLHRDLKPGNLLLDAGNCLRISDFGLATHRDDRREVIVKASPKGTTRALPGIGVVADEFEAEDHTGVTGSYRFMAPEVASSKPYGRPVDVYSFAMILYNVMDGHAPFWLDTPQLAAVKAFKGERPNIPRSWDANIAKMMRLCWAHEPRERPSFPAVLDLFTDAFKSGVVIEDPTAQASGNGNGAAPATTPCQCTIS